jgi:predicted O-methyltransferase YrrM
MKEKLPYDFTKNWFLENSIENWNRIIPVLNPTKILELGCYEGAATCYLIDLLGSKKSLEIHCVDVWDEIDEIKKEESIAVEARFDKNVKIASSNSKNRIDIFKHKMHTHKALSEMIVRGVKDFDLIYIDASHYAPDVLTDAILSYKVLRVGGLLIFDDYLWSGSEDILFYPKIAIDSFLNIFSHDMELIPAPISQIYAVKTNEFLKR